MSWRTDFTARGRRQLRGIDRIPAKKILDQLALLQKSMDDGHTDGLDVLALRMSRPSPRSEDPDLPELRLSVGEFRVVYTCDPGTETIRVNEVGDRKKVYRDRGGR